MAKPKISIYDIVLCALFTAIIAVCSQITVPTFVPFTMQTFAVFCTLGLLGGKRGTVSVLLYVVLGAIGVPVYAELTGGFGIILGYTGGYIIGFVFSALVYWLVTKIFGDGIISMSAAMILGMIVCYLFGTAWYVIVYLHKSGLREFAAALKLCVLPFLIPDAIKIALAAVITRRVKKYVRPDKPVGTDSSERISE